MIFGLILIAIGIIFLLQNLDVIPQKGWGVIWPIVVILIGVGFIVNRFKRRKESGVDRKRVFKEKMGQFQEKGEKWHQEKQEKEDK